MSGGRITTGFTHQDPGFIDPTVVNKKAEVVRVYLPPDANCLLSVMDHCLRSRPLRQRRDRGKHPAPQWLTMDRRRQALHRGIRDFGNGPASDQSVCPTWSWPAVRRAPRWRRSRVSIMREHCPT